MKPTKIKDLFTDESKWTKRAAARDAVGLETYVSSKSACSWCLVGAFQKLHIQYDSDAWKSLKAAIHQKGFNFIADFNDAPERTFADVKALVEKLDI